MGGHALNQLKTERKNKSDYNRICFEVKQRCSSFTKRSEVIPSYFNKIDYGDADILIIENTENLKESIISEFHPRQIVHNGNCYSFDYENFQIDLIQTNDELFESSLNYYSYNDLGNLIGRIAHKFGLKYGHNGLTLPIRKTDSHLGETITVSRDTRKILDFLGFDAETFFNGFFEVEDIFNYVTSSKYFNSSIFSYENLNHINRVRNRKRKVYDNFLKWLSGKKFNEFEFNPDKSVYLENVIRAFPETNLKAEIDRVSLKIENSYLISQKFNGNLVAELTGLSGINLGFFLRNFRDQKISELGSKDFFEKWILTTDQTEINIQITNHHEQIKENLLR